MDANDILAWLSQFPVIWIYAAIVTASFLENIFPPLPGDTFVIIGAVLAANGILDLYTVFFVTSISSLLSMTLVYHLARLKGRPYFERMPYFVARQSKIRKVEDLFQRHGDKIILISRFLAGIRPFVVILAGLVNVQFYKMMIYSALGIALWHGLLIYGGYQLAQNWQQVLDFLAIYNRFVLILIVITSLVFITYRWRNHSNL